MVDVPPPDRPAFAGPGDLPSPAYRALLVGLLRDNWAAEAANLSVTHHARACPLHLAPRVADRAALAAYWADECRHASSFAALLDELGEGPSDADYDAERPTEALRLPIETWADFALFQVFSDTAGVVHLADYRTSTYLPLRRAAITILRDEVRHVRLGVTNLRTALGEPGGRERAEVLLPEWIAAGDRFFGVPGRVSARTAALLEAGLRRRPNDALRRDYRRRIRAVLADLHLPVPETYA